MFISMAHAADAAIDATNTIGADIAAEPTGLEAFMMGPIAPLVLFVVVFYLFLIRPQQKRLKEHKEMIESLKKGDEVITSGGLVGKIEKVTEEKEEVVVNLGDGVKVTAMKSYLQKRTKEEEKDKTEKKD